jgi:hypothetical protein
MYLHLVFERPWSWKPSLHRSSISTRVMWGWFAVAKIHVSEYEYATTEYDWVVPKDWTPPPKYAGERFRRVTTRRGITRA